MRILRLVAEGDFAIEFHPYITVVTGLDGDRRDRIVDAFEKAARGRTTTLDGLIEVHGVVLDLDDRALELLELDESGGATSVVSHDLPGNASNGVDRGVRLAERRLEGLEQPRRDRLRELEEAEAALEGARRAEALTDEALSDHERDERIEDLHVGLSLHRLYDAAPIQEALDDLRAAHRTGETVPSAEALCLADRLGELRREIEAIDASGPVDASTAALDAAKERLERARLSLAALERDSAGEADGGGDVAGLEKAHAEVERARDSLDGRFGRARAQRRLDEARAAEDELLERLGLQSYTEYLTLGGSVRPEIGAGSDLDAARSDVVDARAEVTAIQASIDDALAEAELIDERRRVLEEARRLLDDPDLPDEAIMTELIDVRVPADPSSPLDRLAEALTAVGLPVLGLDLSGEEIETMAADWLAEYKHAESRLVRRIDELDTPVTVASARLAVAEAARALDDVEVEYAAAVEELAALRQSIPEVEDEPPSVGELEWYLLARLAAQRQQPFVGSLPLVIAGALDDLPDEAGLVHLLDRLERMAGAVQIVHITDDPRIVDWGNSLEDGRGAVVRPMSTKADPG